MHRRQILQAVPLTAFAISADCMLRAQDSGLASEGEGEHSSGLLDSPPVVQHRTPTGFSVVSQVSSLATGWVDWGTSPDHLPHRSVAQHHGLKVANDLALHIRVEHGSALKAANIYYRVTAVPLKVQGRQVLYGSESAGSVFRLRPSIPDESRIHIGIVNDTHENAPTLARLAQRVRETDPDLLLWNGDTCNDFHPEKNVASILLKPGATSEPSDGGWASTRPLIFVPGNHDVRGRLAYQLQTCLPGWPSGLAHSGLGAPYCSMHRIGPVALVTLDTGEDKPDAHPSFQGTAAYEPYRELQARWLKEVVEHADFKSARYKLAVCHIPLRGLPGHPDGTSLDGYAYFSGFGARLWLDTLIAANVKTILSGHMHKVRLDPGDDKLPTQIVLGGPQMESASYTRIVGDQNGVAVIVENLDGKVLIHHPLP